MIRAEVQFTWRASKPRRERERERERESPISLTDELGPFGDRTRAVEPNARPFSRATQLGHEVECLCVV